MSRKPLVLITSTILSLVLLVHFSFTFIYLSPANNWKDQHWETLIKYMNPYFTQNWKLFAPNPADQQLNLDMRVQYVDQAGATRETAWRSISWPVVQSLQHNRISPNARISEFQSSLIGDFIWGDKTDKQTSLESMQIYTNYIIKNGKFIVPGEIKKIQLRAVRNEFPRYSERNKPDSAGKIDYYYSNWWNYSNSNEGGKKV